MVVASANTQQVRSDLLVGLTGLGRFCHSNRKPYGLTGSEISGGSQHGILTI